MIDLSDIRAYARRLHLRGVESMEIQEGNRLISIHVESPMPASQAPAPEAASITVRSATLGRLRRSHDESLPVRIEPGDEVVKGQLLALVALDESLTAVLAPADGVIDAVLAADDQIVDYGMPLFQLKPTQR
ncbi:acetyl-CoA carboxylase biotin carboxyl carrier protein [Achromobacter denitrificans]|uniref:acetyl-CoA carboxylase biotin carboxyl carrier protein n=1 Tax=Achromobacter denitrificans TaxID=32002 RepID=UPI0023E83246|nr:acetyl-CoA carboxylase biotin carboxyl carrier protein subunit [Achromobacter denitrificans]MDF3848796.1 acetyl-CoA carboxylase biotin carboxyl carrier protein subunit [Achromobacter denitrificans]